jgi:ABC-2 type transport system ATP-binding protein
MSYGNQLAVKDVSFLVRSGEVMGLLGPNGAGKSTTMLILAGLLAPTSGEVFLNGQKFDGRNLDQRRSFGIVPQEYAIYEELSALANLMFFGRLYGLRKQKLKARCDEVIDQIGLIENAHRPANTYSLSRSHLMECIQRQTDDGGCVIYASHYMEEAQSICQRVVILDQGEVIANDATHHLLAGIASDLYLYVDHTTGISNELGDLTHVGTGSNKEPVVIISGKMRGAHDPIDEMLIPNGRASLATRRVSPTLDLGKKLQATLEKLTQLGIRVLSVETQQSTLERLFLQLTGKRSQD